MARIEGINEWEHAIATAKETNTTALETSLHAHNAGQPEVADGLTSIAYYAREEQRRLEHRGPRALNVIVDFSADMPPDQEYLVPVVHGLVAEKTNPAHEGKGRRIFQGDYVFGQEQTSQAVQRVGVIHAMTGGSEWQGIPSNELPPDALFGNQADTNIGVTLRRIHTPRAELEREGRFIKVELFAAKKSEPQT